MAKMRSLAQNNGTRLPLAMTLLITFTMLAVVVAGDYVTGPYFIFDLFYLAPILFMTWHRGQRAGSILAAVCAVLWYVVMRAVNHPLTHPWMWAWNVAIRFLVTYVVVWLLAHLKRETIELRDALSQVHLLRGMLPICAWCKKIRNDEGYWQQIEQYVQEHSDATFTHGICPACATTVFDGELRGRERERRGQPR